MEQCNFVRYDSGRFYVFDDPVTKYIQHKEGKLLIDSIHVPLKVLDILMEHTDFHDGINETYTYEISGVVGNGRDKVTALNHVVILHKWTKRNYRIPITFMYEGKYGLGNKFNACYTVKITDSPGHVINIVLENKRNLRCIREAMKGAVYD